MKIMSASKVQPLLVCPRCRSNLLNSKEYYYCSNLACIYSQPNSFPLVQGCPALVDFERSILDRAELEKTAGASPVKRENALGKQQLKNILFPNPVARKQAFHLKKLICECSANPIVLVIGGGSVGAGSECLYETTELQIISFDIYASPSIQFIADAHSIPLDDQSVDAVWCQNVLEHVLEPFQVVSEIYRVLKCHGIVYAETPFLQHVHEGAYDFSRFTESGHRWLFKNFERLNSGVVTGPGHQLVWTIENLARYIFRSNNFRRVIRALIFWLAYLDKLIPRKYAVDGAASVFFLGRKSEKVMSPQEIVEYYQGSQKIRA